MISSWIYAQIYPLETSIIGGIMANGSKEEHLSFPSLNEKTGEFDYNDISKTFISNDYGLKFAEVIILLIN